MVEHDVVASATDFSVECDGLRRRVTELEDELAEHRAQRAAVADALVRATRYGARLREEARADAELALQKVASVVVKRAAAAERERADAERRLDELRRLVQETRSGLEALLSQTIEQLHASSPPDTAPALQESLIRGIELATADSTDGLSGERPWHASS